MFQVPCHVKTCSKTASLLRMNGMPWWRDARHGNRVDRPLPRETKSRQGTYQNISFGTQYFLLDLMRGCFGHLLMGSHFYKIRISVREKKKLSLLQRKNVWKHQTVKKYRFVLWTLFANIWNGQLRASWMNVSGQDASDEIGDRWSEIEVRHSNQSLLYLFGLLQRRYPVNASTPTNQPGWISTAHTICKTLF